MIVVGGVFCFCFFVFWPYILTFCAHVISPFNIAQLRDVKNPRTNSFCICDYMLLLYKWPTAYSYLWTLSEINKFATVEKWLQTIFPSTHPLCLHTPFLSR